MNPKRIDDKLLQKHQFSDGARVVGKKLAESCGRQQRYHSDDRPSANFSEIVDIKSNHLGRLIGRSGANINRIENGFKVHLHVDRNAMKVMIKGNNKYGVKDAADHVRKQLAEFSQSPYKYRGSGQHSDDRDSSNYRRLISDASSDIDRKQRKTRLYGRESKSPLIDWEKFKENSERAAKLRLGKYLPLRKDFYVETLEVASLTEEEVNRIRKDNNDIMVNYVFNNNKTETEKIPNPVWKFEQCFAPYPDLLDEIKKQGFEKPSPIQAQAWPIVLSGKDMIGIAQTGTGKTLAFLLPAMIHTEYQSTPRGKRGGANVLILTPTRELALQIESEIKKYHFRNMRGVCIYGGGNRSLQITDLERGAEIIVCTPGRLNDLIQAKVIDISSVTFLVLDEADRMLDLGFEPQIRKILIDIRPDRQTVMTSATWPPDARRLAQSYMTNPIQLWVGSLDLTAAHSVQQIIKIMNNDEDKYDNIKLFVERMHPNDKIIVFCSRKARADDLSSDLTLAGHMTQCIHGNRDQQDREQALEDIRSGYVRILIATDVASRGIDIDDISHVINYDLPRNIEEYVHRIGRTGRAGRTGISISYVTREDWSIAGELIDILEKANQNVPDELRNMASRFIAMKERRDKEGGGGKYRRGNGFSQRYDRY